MNEKTSIEKQRAKLIRIELIVKYFNAQKHNSAKKMEHVYLMDEFKQLAEDYLKKETAILAGMETAEQIVPEQDVKDKYIDQLEKEIITLKKGIKNETVIDP